MPKTCTVAMLYNRPAALKMLAAWDPHSRTQILAGTEKLGHLFAAPGGLHNKKDANFDWEMQQLVSNGAVQWAARAWVDISSESVGQGTSTVAPRAIHPKPRAIHPSFAT